MSALSSTKLCLCWVSAALVVAAIGCSGDSSDSGSGGSGGSGGSTGSGASGGTGGDTSGGTGGSTTGGSGGSGATGGTGGGISDAGSVVCGSTVCAPPTWGMGNVPACCTTQNTCGAFIFNTCSDGSFDAGPLPEAGPPGVPDPNCAGAMLGTTITLPGCCRSDNTCGFQSQFFGCTTYDSLRMIPGINLPEGGPMTCVYPPP